MTSNNYTVCSYVANLMSHSYKNAIHSVLIVLYQTSHAIVQKKSSHDIVPYIYTAPKLNQHIIKYKYYVYKLLSFAFL